MNDVAYLLVTIGFLVAMVALALLSARRIDAREHVDGSGSSTGNRRPVRSAPGPT
jgi:hypothetical protein